MAGTVTRPLSLGAADPQPAEPATTLRIVAGLLLAAGILVAAWGLLAGLAYLAWWLS